MFMGVSAFFDAFFSRFGMEIDCPGFTSQRKCEKELISKDRFYKKFTQKGEKT